MAEVKNERKYSVARIMAETMVILLVGSLIGELMIMGVDAILKAVAPAFQKTASWTTAAMYLEFVGIWLIVFFVLTMKKYRYLTTWIGRRTKGNNWYMLLIGLVMGFALNALCILVAWLNKDIVLYYDHFDPLPFFAIFIAVFIQSSAEEVLCRGFMYRQLVTNGKSKRYAIIANALLFTLLHFGNDGVTVLSLINLFLVGIVFSMMTCYWNSIWSAFAMHAGWNFTQNIIFGLPNSGRVVPFSVWKLEAASARNSWAYNVGFGIEGTLFADLVLLATCVVLYFVWGREKLIVLDGPYTSEEEMAALTREEETAEAENAAGNDIEEGNISDSVIEATSEEENV